MSERYIFNKKLNRTPRFRPYLFGLVLASVGLMYDALHHANAQQQLLDPQGEINPVFTNTLNNIEFTRLTNGGASTTLSFDNTGIKPQLVETNDQLIVIFPRIALTDEQYVELDVAQFATPVTKIESFQEDKESRLVFDLIPPQDGGISVEHSQTDNQLVINVLPVAKEDVQKEVASPYSGKPISLDFQDVPVRQVLQIIAKVNGFNLVTTDTVTGNVTISLSDVPWDQALEMILKIKGLDKRLEGNILLVAPSEELTARETQVLQSKKQVADLAPLYYENIIVNYAKAEAMSQLLKTADGGILSQRGSVAVDERTNTLLIRDTRESIDEARRMVESLDIPVKQVLIESRMVTVRDNVSEELGVRWGFSDRQGDEAISGSLEGADSVASGLVPTIDNRLNVNLPVSNPNAGSIGFQIASLANGTIIDLELSALESENKGEIIASPRLTVANQQEAYIEQGTEIPYVQATSSGATSVEFKKAVLSLKVTPQITPDNRIILDLVVTQDTRGDTVQTSTGNAVAIDTQEIKTQVLVENGETVVLGGIFQQISTNDISKVPLFGDLPVVGRLFQNSSDVYQKRELLIFVTPKIVTEEL